MFQTSSVARCKPTGRNHLLSPLQCPVESDKAGNGEYVALGEDLDGLLLYQPAGHLQCTADGKHKSAAIQAKQSYTS